MSYTIDMFSVRYRFHGHGSLRYVFKNGQAVRSHLMTLRYVSNPRRKSPRFSVIVSKKVHKSAVGRNRIRRRIYEIVRRNLGSLNGIYDVAIIVSSSEVMTAEASDLEVVVLQLFREARMYG